MDWPYLSPAPVQKSFLVYRKIKGKPVRITLGRFPNMTVEQARKQALSTLSKIADGINPNDEKRQHEATNVSLQEVFDTYLNTRKNLKKGTVLDYQKTLRQTFSDWLHKPLCSITKDKVLKRHASRGKESPARANNAFSCIKSFI